MGALQLLAFYHLFNVYYVFMFLDKPNFPCADGFLNFKIKAINNKLYA